MCWCILRTPLLATDVAGRGLDVQARCVVQRSFSGINPKWSRKKASQATYLPMQQHNDHLHRGLMVFLSRFDWMFLHACQTVEFFLRTWSWWLITPSHWRSRSPWDCCAGVLSRVSTRFSQDYTHRIGRTGRAGKKGGQMWAEHQATWSAMSTNKWIWNLKWYEQGRKKGSTKDPPYKTLKPFLTKHVKVIRLWNSQYILS